MPKPSGCKHCNEWKIIVTAILSVTLLDAIALIRGIDGIFFALSLVVVSGLGGYRVKGILEKFLR